MNALKEYWRLLRSGTPGRRFRRVYDVRKERRHGQGSLSYILSILAGVALVGLGLSIGWLPGPGGFIAIIGLALLVQHFRALATLLDWLELRLLRLGRWTLRLWKRSSAATQVALVLAILSATGGLGYAVFATVFSP